jgi:hypothetical protein
MLYCVAKQVDENRSQLANLLRHRRVIESSPISRSNWVERYALTFQGSVSMAIVMGKKG